MFWAVALFPLALAADCPGYKASNVKHTANAVTADLALAGEPCNVYGDDFPELRLIAEYQTDNRLHVKIYDAEEQMFQIPASLLPQPTATSPKERDLEFSLKSDPFSFTVKRKSNNETLFDTTGEKLVFESQYLRLRTSLSPSSNIYGLGESADSFRHDTSNYSHAIWTAGEPFMPQNANLYGAYPVYYDHRGSNGTHAVYLRNMNAMRINLSNNVLEYNIIGGIFDLYFLSGPTPKAASVQFSEVVGKPAMMPYWGFGFHQCRFGYQDAYETAAVVANYSVANIPLETVWNDIDYMDYRSTFSVDPIRFPLQRMRTLIDHLHSHDQHYIMMLDPAVAAKDYKPYNDGVKMNALMKESNGSIYTGVVWGGPSSFPDWFAPSVQNFWNEQFDSFFDRNNGVDIDGLWIDMNEPSNFCDYPCTNPKQFATEARNPPRPPPARMHSPYKIPGFPEEFQPHCMSTITFEVKAELKDGEDLLILGDALSIGNGTPRLAPQLRGDNGVHRITVQLPANSTTNYSYPRYTHEGQYVYEAKNRTVKTGDCGYTATVIDTSSYPANGQKSQRTTRDDDPLNRQLISPPYDIHNYFGQLSGQTMPTNLYHANGMVEYDVHSFYGSQMGAKSRQALLQRRPGRRPLIITRSSIAGDGARVGHWFGDNRAIDDDYRLSIVQMIQFPALFQVPMVGSDVCGFNYDTNPILCARWAVLGSWNPFFRNHAEISSRPQEFYRWDIVADAARKAIAMRYRLLDYTYSNLYRQSQTGVPMMTPLVWQFPEDEATHDIELQFFAGDALLVSPVTEPNSTSVEFYLPKGCFYDFWTHEKVESKGAQVKKDNVEYDEIPVHIRGGSIIPLRTKSAYTTTALRKEHFELIVAPDEHGKASGFLYLDDGDSLKPKAKTELHFSYKDGVLTSNGTFGYNPHVKLARITFLGCRGKETVKNVNFPLTGPFAYSISC